MFILTILFATGAFLIFFTLELGYAIQSLKWSPVLANITDYAFIEELDDDQQLLRKSVVTVRLEANFKRSERFIRCSSKYFLGPGDDLGRGKMDYTPGDDIIIYIDPHDANRIRIDCGPNTSEWLLLSVCCFFASISICSGVQALHLIW